MARHDARSRRHRHGAAEVKWALLRLERPGLVLVRFADETAGAPVRHLCLHHS
jgi:hypothetical protein